MEGQRQNAILEHDLKDKVRNLAVEYNTFTDTRNQQQSLMNKYNLFLSLENEKLNNQVDYLKNIESHVATRDSLVRGNQIEYVNKKKQIHVIKVFFILMAFLVFVLVAYLGQKITLLTFLSVAIGALIFYSIYVSWVYNIFLFKTFTKYIDHDLERMKQDIYEEGRRIEEDINNYVYGNCDCPLKPISPKGNQPNKLSQLLPLDNKNGGIFYYDNTAPVQKIYPPSKDEYKIDWNSGPDMGSRSNARYTPLPLWMPKTVGLPKAGYDHEGKQCSR